MRAFVCPPARVWPSCLVTALLACLLALVACPVLAQASIEATGDAPVGASSPADQDAGVVSIGGQVVMRLRSSAGGMSTEQRVDAIEDRLTRLVAVPDIKTSDVIVYMPIGKPPVIYVLGRRLITVDPATVKSAGGGDAGQLATLWAKRLQQILPRVDIRLPNEPEPKVPSHPPLKITSDLSLVEGDVGDVTFRGKTVMRFRGVQPGNITAAERADMLSDRLNRLAHRLNTSAPDAVTVASVDSQSQTSSEGAPKAKAAAATSVKEEKKNEVTSADDGPAQLLMGGKLVYTVTMADTKDTGGGTPQALANSWAKNIRVALCMPPNGVPATPATAPAAPASPNTPATAAPPPPPSPGILPGQPATPTTPPSVAPPATAAPTTSSPAPAAPPSATTTPDAAAPSAPAQKG